jgi:vacuolar-type H+-ATPase subunit I/STV1
MSMILEYGDIKKPTGNAVIYWIIKGKNRLFEDAEIIASNFVISPLQFGKEILMVNFPPVLLESHEKLIKIAELNNIDIIRGGEIYVPGDIKDFQKFYLKQIEKYNGVIQEYLIAYKKKNSMKESLKNLPQLIHEASEVMENVRQLVKKRDKKGLINVKIEKLKEIQQNLNSEMRGFDLGRIIRYIDRPDSAVDSLVTLYTQKFFAIFLEDYEKASILKEEIKRIEQSLI